MKNYNVGIRIIYTLLRICIFLFFAFFLLHDEIDIQFHKHCHCAGKDMLALSHVDIKFKEDKIKLVIEIIAINFLSKFDKKIVFNDSPFSLCFLSHGNLSAPTILRL